MADKDNANHVPKSTASSLQPDAKALVATGATESASVKQINGGSEQDPDDLFKSMLKSGACKNDGDLRNDIHKRLLMIKSVGIETFMVRWNDCNTWEKFQSLLENASSRADEATRQLIREGKYIVKRDWTALDRGSDRFYIPPELWKNVLDKNPPIKIFVSVQPEIKTCIEGESEVVESDAGPTIDNASCDSKIKYTVNYYQKNDWGRGPSFLHSYSSTAPVVDGLWKTPSGLREPVFEEMNDVLFPEYRQPSKRSHGDRFKYDEDALDDLLPTELSVLEAGDHLHLPSVHIYSSLLLNALGAVVKYWSKDLILRRVEARYENEESDNNGDNFRGGIFRYPFRDLYYHKQELIEYKVGKYACCTKHPDDYQRECGEHIDLLLKYLYAQSDIGLAAVEAGWARKVPTTSFASFWLLMKPGTDVYVRKKGVLNAMVVDCITGGIKFSGRGKAVRTEPYTVTVWGMWFDGNVMGRISITVEVPVFDNEREIRSLPLFPVRFQDETDGGATRQKLVRRGKKFFKCCREPTYMECTGIGSAGRTTKYTRARVIVDHFDHPWKSLDHGLGHDCEFDRKRDEKSEDRHRHCWHERTVNRHKPGFSARSPRCECTHCLSVVEGGTSYPPETHSDYDNIIPGDSKALTEHQYLLCWDQMFAFILKDRNYDLLDVEDLVAPQLSDDAIESLVLKPESNKDAIKALVETYTDQPHGSNLFSADFIHNKGEGQVILLHGPPGTGKTLTAESVAEFTRKPLVSITAADLGHEPQDLERNLTRFLKNAHVWGAVVLLDEADIYLQRRSNNDLKRNSIVSIFLRLLDYFQGILFLTSNRVGHIDEAFMSRIHIALGYQPLDDDARSRIWDNLFRKIQDDYKRGSAKIEYEYDAKQFVKKNDELRALQWNGREIRNAFQTVVALATSDARKVAEKKGESTTLVVPEIRETHLKKVVEMSAAFRKYMVSTHEGMDDKDLAFRLGNRDDRAYEESDIEEGLPLVSVKKKTWS